MKSDCNKLSVKGCGSGEFNFIELLCRSQKIMKAPICMCALPKFIASTHLINNINILIIVF